MSLLDRIAGGKKRVSLSLVDDPTQFVEFEATLRIAHSGDATMTQHPVEDGADLSDHVKRLPEKLGLTVVTSDHPLVFLPSINAEASVPGGDPRNRSQDMYKFLTNIKNNGYICKVSTKLQDYPSLVILGLSCEQDKDTAQITQIDLSFGELIIATTETVAPPTPVNSSRSKKENQGKKQKKPTDGKKSKSVLSRIFGAFE